MKLTRRSAIALLPAASTGLRALAGAPSGARSKLYIGTYTHTMDGVAGAKGIYTAAWNATNGTLGELQLIVATPDPSFLALSPRHPDMLFAVNEIPDKNGTVSVFTITPGKSQLTQRSVEDTRGASPCHLALDRTGKSLFVANYDGGSVASYKVTSQGIGKAASLIQFTGNSITPRQTLPHAHCVVFSPDDRFLLVNDLGLDRIAIFHVNPDTATLTPAAKPYYSAAPGSGPRHCRFHPNGRWLYSANELGSTVDTLDWSPSDGAITHKDTISSLPPEARHKNSAVADMAIDSAGKFLYVSNRFHDSIGVFTIDQNTGKLSPLEDVPCGGKTPRHFTIDPSGNWVLVANQDSSNIAVFKRNSTTGKLTATGKSYPLGLPVCLLFA